MQKKCWHVMTSARMLCGVSIFFAFLKVFKLLNMLAKFQANSSSLSEKKKKKKDFPHERLRSCFRTYF